MLIVQSKKTDNDINISKIEKKFTDHNHNKYITAPEFNKFTAEIFAARLVEANLVTMTDFDNRLISLNRKVISNKTKNTLIENEFKKLQTFDSSYFRGKSHFEEDGLQNYLIFQPINKYFKRITGVILFRNLKFYLRKELILLLNLITALLQN